LQTVIIQKTSIPLKKETCYNS